MQVKKEEVKNAILKYAEKEFIEKGFERASIRSIVKSAGTTIGNFYNYFENKEAVFEELVKDDYNNFTHFIQNHDSYEGPDYLWETMDIEQWRNVLKVFIEQFLPMFGNGFLLLIESSKGTKYANAKDTLIGYIEKHFIEHIHEYSSDKAYNPHFANLIASQFLDGVVKIIKNHHGIDVRKELLSEHILFYFLGTMALIKN